MGQHFRHCCDKITSLHWTRTRYHHVKLDLGNTVECTVCMLELVNQSNKRFRKSLSKGAAARALIFKLQE